VLYLKYIFSLFVLVISLFYLSNYEALSLFLTTYCFIEFIDSIGNKFNIVELVIPYTTISCLAMPVLAYHVFNEENELAALWVTFMPVSSPVYFSFVLPAVFLFILGIKFPFKLPYNDYQFYIKNAKVYLFSKGSLSILFLLLGVICTYLVKITPTVIQNIVQNFAYLTYVGMFYAIYSNFKRKNLVIFVCVLLVLLQVIGSGMYGELIYMSVIFTLIFIVSKKGITMPFKTSLVCIGVILLLFIQSIKNEYRAVSWDGLERNANASAFLGIVVDRITHPSKLFDLDAIFNMTVRLNQGSIVGRVIDYVPKSADYGHGNMLFKSLFSALIPRFLWLDKPITGGSYNVCRFLGDCESALRGMSYNIGPLGESYAHFGRVGGCIFMFFYGLFMKYLYVFTLRLLPKRPSLLMWYPVLYMGYFSIETDILAFVNSFAKTGLFISVMFFIFPRILKLKI
jgi:hypothetical protein